MQKINQHQKSSFISSTGHPVISVCPDIEATDTSGGPASHCQDISNNKTDTSLAKLMQKKTKKQYQ